MPKIRVKTLPTEADEQKATENDLIKGCLEFLSYKKIFHYRNNSGAFKTDRGGFYYFGAKGSPDIIAVLTIWGLPVMTGIEAKTKNGKQSEYQKLWQKNFEKVGGFYLLIRSLDELETKLKYVRNKALSILSERNENKTVAL
jgi:hypothetical protein